MGEVEERVVVERLEERDRSEEASAGAEHALDFADGTERVGQMLQHRDRHDQVEGIVSKREDMRVHQIVGGGALEVDAVDLVPELLEDRPLLPMPAPEVERDLTRPAFGKIRDLRWRQVNRNDPVEAVARRVTRPLHAQRHLEGLGVAPRRVVALVGQLIVWTEPKVPPAIGEARRDAPATAADELRVPGIFERAPAGRAREEATDRCRPHLSRASAATWQI